MALARKAETANVIVDLDYTLFLFIHESVSYGILPNWPSNNIILITIIFFLNEAAGKFLLAFLWT